MLRKIDYILEDSFIQCSTLFGWSLSVANITIWNGKRGVNIYDFHVCNHPELTKLVVQPVLVLRFYYLVSIVNLDLAHS